LLTVARKPSGTLSLAGAVGVLVAAVCCAGLPAAAALLAGFGSVALFGGSAALFLAGVVSAVWVVRLRARQRRAAAARWRARS
jgi:hypothetical protein